MTGFDRSRVSVGDSDKLMNGRSHAQMPNTVLHNWVTVVNPSNQRLLLQACDDCGVVKSENSVIKLCRAAKGQALISNAMSTKVRLVRQPLI